jgi:benzodiazapine receptor
MLQAFAVAPSPPKTGSHFSARCTIAAKGGSSGCAAVGARSRLEGKGRTLGEIASKQQLRLAFVRWAVVTVPFILLLGFSSARLAPTGSSNRWYVGLTKPAGTPPDWAFPVAWATIYILLGCALAIIINARGSRLRGPAIALFALQMVVNLIWSPLFFGMHHVLWSLAALAAMFVLTLATAILFGRIRAVAAWLLVPYLVWLLYAGALGYGIYELNPDAETLVPSSSTTQIINS